MWVLHSLKGDGGGVGDVDVDTDVDGRRVWLKGVTPPSARAVAKKGGQSYGDFDPIAHSRVTL